MAIINIYTMKYNTLLLLVIAVFATHVYCEALLATVTLNLGDSSGGLLFDENDNITYRTTVDENKLGQNEFIHYQVQSPTPVCLFINPDSPPTQSTYVVQGCTTSKRKTVSLFVDQQAKEETWFARVYNNNQKPAAFDITIFNTTSTSSPPTPGTPPTPSHECNVSPDPSISPSSAYKWEGYCWYLGNVGLSCDHVCKALGGDNLALFAQYKFPSPRGTQQTCSATASNMEPIAYWYYKGGNPFNWSTIASSVEHNLGYGIQNSRADCHSTNGVRIQRGSYPNEVATERGQSLVCPCFAV